MGVFVWAGRRWRAVGTDGVVEGWRGARFVFRARGRLQVASTRAVLRGIKALLAGRPTTVRDGPPLSQRRRRRPSLTNKGRCSACARRGECTADHENGTNNNKEDAPKPHIGDPPTKVETGVQVTLEACPPPPAPRDKRQRSSSSEPRVIRKRVRVDIHRSSSGSDDVQKSPDSSDIPLAQKRGATQTQNSQFKSQTQLTQSQNHCKELVINEQDVDLYRSYLIRNDPHFDVYRFDIDERYKLSIFFRINPLVNIERSARIERMLRGSQSSQEMSLKDFATKLGLQSISDQEDTVSRRYKMRSRAEKLMQELTSDEDTDKENQMVDKKEDSQIKLKKKVLEQLEKEDARNRPGGVPKKKLYTEPSRSKLMPVQLNKKKNVTDDRKAKKSDPTKKINLNEIRVVSATSSDSDFVKKPSQEVKKAAPVKKLPVKTSAPVGPKRGGWAARPLNAYSSLEDHAIVAWVSVGGRERRVNGNRLWRELQGQYERLTGRSRSWHSLRNRYLRYVLPALAALALAPPLQARLRAGAAKGELKLKSKSVSRRNSIFSCPSVRSAFAARPRPRLQIRGDSSDEDSQPRSGRARGRPRSESPHEPDDTEQYNKRSVKPNLRDKSSEIVKKSSKSDRSDRPTRASRTRKLDTSNERSDSPDSLNKVPKKSNNDSEKVREKSVKRSMRDKSSEVVKKLSKSDRSDRPTRASRTRKLDSSNDRSDLPDSLDKVPKKSNVDGERVKEKSVRRSMRDKSSEIDKKLSKSNGSNRPTRASRTRKLDSSYERSDSPDSLDDFHHGSDRPTRASRTRNRVDTPTHAQLTRPALRSTPKEDDTKPHRTRKLFNPNAFVR